jgi:glycine betaine/choline ABC-type transport system substrate-binding protein
MKYLNRTGTVFFFFPVLLLSACSNGERPIVVGSKNFTESVLLGELVAQQLERHGLPVDRKLNLGGSFICHNALVAGQLDVYVEYTGTAYAAILEMPDTKDPGIVRSTLDSVYQERWDLVWMGPLGFNNTFALLIRNEDATRLGISRLSQIGPYSASWRFGAGYEFIERADGYRGLLAFYGLSFRGEPLEMDLGLTYRALAEGTVDIIAGNSTDGQIEALDLFHLEDDRRYFPPYEAVPVVRADLLERFPVADTVLAELANTLTEAEIRRLNYLVDVEKRDVGEVAAEFLGELVGRGPAELRSNVKQLRPGN